MSIQSRSPLAPRDDGRLSRAYRFGRFLQGCLLALAFMLVVARLIQVSGALNFRYGGF